VPVAGSPDAALVLSADQEDNLNSLKSQLSASQAKVDVLAADAVDPDAVS
jgi:short-subunit dehydrogenase